MLKRLSLGTALKATLGLTATLGTLERLQASKAAPWTATQDELYFETAGGSQGILKDEGRTLDLSLSKKSPPQTLGKELQELGINTEGIFKTLLPILPHKAATYTKTPGSLKTSAPTRNSTQALGSLPKALMALPPRPSDNALTPFEWSLVETEGEEESSSFHQDSLRFTTASGVEGELLYCKEEDGIYGLRLTIYRGAQKFGIQDRGVMLDAAAEYEVIPLEFGRNLERIGIDVKQITSVSFFSPDASLPFSKIREFGSFAFTNFHNLKSAYLPQCLAVIGPFCFAHTALREVQLTRLSSLKTIGAYAFSDCPIRTLSWPATENPQLRSLGHHAFSSCLLEYIPGIPASVEFVGKYAFAHNQDLEGLTFEGEVVEIEPWAFLGCSSFRWLSFPEATNLKIARSSLLWSDPKSHERQRVQIETEALERSYNREERAYFYELAREIDELQEEA